MKRLLAGLIAGIVLGTTGTAIAGAQVYWLRGGNGYTCEGISQGVSCKSGLYEVGVTRDFVYIQKRSTKQTIGCGKYARFTACVSD